MFLGRARLRSASSFWHRPGWKHQASGPARPPANPDLALVLCAAEKSQMFPHRSLKQVAPIFPPPFICEI